MDEAYKAVEKYKESDPSLYTVLCKHITNETIFPRFALIELYYTSYAESTLYAMRKSFKQDCEMLGVKMYREAMNYGELEKKYEIWGLN